MANFNLNLIGFTAEQEEIFTAACTEWGDLLQNPVTINVQAQFLPLGAVNPGLEAMSIPNLVQGNDDGVNITVTTAQAKALDSGDFPPVPEDTVDMVILINSATEFNYTMEQNANTNFFTLCLHEVCHGLGFVALCNVNEADDTGIFTDANLLLALAPVAQYIPFFPHLQTLQSNYPTLFASKFMAGAGLAYQSPPPTIYQYFTTQDSMVIPYNVPQQPVENYNVYTPEDFSAFSSCDHINYDENCLMYYTIANNVYFEPDYRTKNILRLIGWGVN